MKRSLLLPCSIVLLAIHLRGATAGARVHTANNFHAQKYADIPSPRGLFLDSFGDILVLSKSQSSIIALSQTPNSDGSVIVKQDVIVNGSALGLTHGVTHYKNFVYASSATNVYRWQYDAGDRTLVTTPHQVVVHNLPFGGYSTRTLVFHPSTLDTLYVTVGSMENVDPNSNRARILEFNVATIPEGGFDASLKSVTVFADGLRNTVGLGFDAKGELWGVDNSVEGLSRPDLGGDIHNNNPAEELNKLTSSTNYGYPYCFSSFEVLNGRPKNTQFVWPTFNTPDGIYNDAWCQTLVNNQPPVVALPAHTAPLGIQFYNKCPEDIEGHFDCSFVGNAFFAHHGSTNSDKRVGYRVTRVPFNSSALPTGVIEDVVYEADIETCDISSTCFRPVNAIFDSNGHLIVSSDATGEIFRVTYGSPPSPIAGSGIALTVSAISLLPVVLFSLFMNI